MSVLEPLHLARLEARGAPVRALATDEGCHGLFCEAHEGILLGSGYQRTLAHRIPSVWDVHDAVDDLLAKSTSVGERPGAETLRGPVVQDAASMLGTFVPIALEWSPRAHAKFPQPAQRRAAELLWVGAALRRAPKLGLPLDLFVALVLPRVIARRSSPGGVGEAGKLLKLAQGKLL